MPRGERRSDLERLHSLAVEKCAGRLSDEGAEELSHMLRTSAEARREYLSINAIHARLGWELGGAARAAGVIRSGRELSERLAPASQWRRPGVVASLAIAASLLIGLFLWSGDDQRGRGFAAPGREGAAPASGEVIGSLRPLVSGSKWSFGRKGDAAQSIRAGDSMVVESGAVQVRLVSNTLATLEAPAMMQAVSSGRFRLLQGELKLEVAEGDEGFVVETETAEVIDLGTVFSVGVASGATDLVVFDGEVDLKVSATDAEADSFTRRFRAGEAVQVSRDGTLSRIVNVRQADYADPAKTPRQPVILEVRDSNTRDDMYSFYEIVPGGMREDAKAFVDRPHEWNGIFSSRGMPAYLLGGDYVKTFNDDKVDEGLALEVRIARPASLYVLMDKRLRAPRWLEEDFEPTGDSIGVDEAHGKPGSPHTFDQGDLRTGPGRGIKRHHVIWKQVVRSPGVVSLGANGEVIEARHEGLRTKANMYGLVAVPLVEDEE